jgi:hypothetical protein
MAKHHAGNRPLRKVCRSLAGTVDEYRSSRESPGARHLAVCIVVTSAHAWGRLVIFRLTGNGIFVCDAGESCGQTLR